MKFGFSTQVLRARRALLGLALCACSNPSSTNSDQSFSGGAPAAGGTSPGAGGASLAGGSAALPAGASSGGGGTAFSTGGEAGRNGGSTSGGYAASSGGSSAGQASQGGAIVGGTTGVTAGVGSGGAASGGASIGGSTGGSTGGSAGADGNSGSFTLAWQDDFDALDSSRWQAQNFTWEGNAAQFTPDNVSVANGALSMSLTTAPSGSTKPYRGVELRSTKTLTYGKVSARMRFARGSGVVSGLVLFYTPYPNCDWNEIDIEHLGNSSRTSQLNAMVYTGAPNDACTASVSPTQDPLVVSLGVDAEADYHVYDIEWTPLGVR
ncbi:MAG TPA: family 16 glycosylhydrolase, partial [Polyangiaceae bacterium]|nr:family 16 glycosylhydrolase [Polyangiaceae bacterium]